MAAIIKDDINMGIFLDYRFKYLVVILTPNKDIDADILMSFAIWIDIESDEFSTLSKI